MSKYKFVFLLIVALFALSACASKHPTQEATETDPTAVAEETPEAVVSAVPDTECVNCHTDKQHLVDTAAPIVEAEGESKGVG